MLDPIDVAYGAAEVNPISIQIDLNNRMHNLVTDPKAPAYPPDSHRIRQMRRYKRALSEELEINGKRTRTYGYTDPQYRSLVAILRVLAAVLPELPMKTPQLEGALEAHWRDAYEDFHGIVAHFHLTPRRWDPGPGFDWPRLWRGLSGVP
jgi:N-acetyl-anhydromuramyl-L-alanine amidase AmpD